MESDLTRILLADDVPEFRRIIRLTLEGDRRFESSPRPVVVRAVTGAAYRSTEEV